MTYHDENSEICRVKDRIRRILDGEGVQLGELEYYTLKKFLGALKKDPLKVVIGVYGIMTVALVSASYFFFSADVPILGWVAIFWAVLCPFLGLMTLRRMREDARYRYPEWSLNGRMQRDFEAPEGCSRLLAAMADYEKAQLGR